MTGRRSHGRLSALNGVVHQGIRTLTSTDSPEWAPMYVPPSIADANGPYGTLMLPSQTGGGN